MVECRLSLSEITVGPFKVASLPSFTQRLHVPIAYLLQAQISYRIKDAYKEIIIRNPEKVGLFGYR